MKTSGVIADRFAKSLAMPGPVDRPGAEPGPDSASARVDLALLWWAAERSCGDNSQAAAILAELQGADLRAGTVQDATALGLRARLVEALSCAPVEPAEPAPAPVDETTAIARGRQAKVFTGKELRRKRELVLSSGGCRLRITRRDGLQWIDRARDLNLPHCIELEDQQDEGCLDRFQPPEGARPRRFSPANLRCSYLEQGPERDLCRLEGRLGNGRRGFPCVLEILANKQQPGLLLNLRVDNQHPDHRLRICFHGLRDDGYLRHAGTPEWREAERHGRHRLYATLLRATGRLRVGEEYVATPGAQLRGWVEHRFGIGRDLPTGGWPNERWPCAPESRTVDN